MSTLQSVRSNSPSKTEEVVAVLRTEILIGQYRPGERLPSERELSVRFNANRGAVREALKMLEQLGIADVTPGGVRVLPLEDATLEVLGHLLELDADPSPELIGQIFDVLGAMMALSARSALERADADARDKMAEIVERLTALAPNFREPKTREAAQAAWNELSECFLATNGNLVLRLVFNGLRAQFLGTLTNLGLSRQIKAEPDTRNLHLIREAITAGDSEAVANAIIQHFLVVKSVVLSAMASSESNQSR